jgi:hypothetical protein
VGGLKTHLEQAIGSSQEPGTVCTTIFDSLTPEASSLAFVPASRGSIIAASDQYQLFVGRDVGEGRTCVPSRVDDANAQSRAIMLLSFSWSLE